MKKLFLLAVTSAALSFATPVPEPAQFCGTVTLDTLLAGGVNAGGCQVTDKIFSNFSYTGSIAASNINVAFQSNGPIPAGATIQLTPNNGASWSSLNLTFTTSIDQGLCATCQFVAVLDQIFTPPTPNANAATVTHTGFGSVNLSGGSPATLSGQVSISGLSVVTNFTQTAGSTLNQISSTFSQTEVPEPMTFVLSGAGLLALGLLRRRQTKA